MVLVGCCRLGVVDLPGSMFRLAPCGGSGSGERVDQVGTVAGGACAVVNRACQAGSRGQAAGRWMTRRRAERAIRAGTWMSWSRMVAVSALACKGDAAAPAARVRLCAMAARVSQALADGGGFGLGVQGGRGGASGAGQVVRH